MKENIVSADPAGIKKAVDFLKKGKAVVYPTDTAYGLGVNADNLQAVKRLYQIKERGKKQPVHILVSGISMARKYVVFSKEAECLFKKLMPGPLTLVLPLKSKVADGIKYLSAGTGTLGVRLPDNEIAKRLVKKFNRPITTTSANPSAHKSNGTTPYSISASFKQFTNKKNRPDLYLDGGVLKKRPVSTLVRIYPGEKFEILRKGPVSKKRIQKIINEQK